MIGNFFAELFGLIPELFRKEEAWIILFVLFVGGFLSFSLFQITLTPLDIPTILWNIIKATWWFWLFFPLLWIFQSLRNFLAEEQKKEEAEFVLLEIRIPREIQKGPKAMEQILLMAHAFGIFSFEIVTIAGQIHLYIRCLKKQKDIFESSVFSYYPDVELIEVPDYVKSFPQTPTELYRCDMNVWGTEMVLAREEMIPIKMYNQFETASEEKGADPLSIFLEVLAKAKKNEFFCIQILTKPGDARWGDAWRDDLEKLREKVKGGAADPVTGVTTTPEPQKFETLKAIESNIGKPAFVTVIRLFYMAPEQDFSPTFLQTGILSAFNQYSALSLNSFRRNSGVSLEARDLSYGFFFPQTRLEIRRQRMLWTYLHRDFPQETWMGKFLTSHPFSWNFYSRSFLLNVEGIATIFHLPTTVVLTAPHMQRMESRKVGPSAGLPIFGDEADIENFY